MIITQELIETLMVQSERSYKEFTDKYGELLDVYNETDENKILEIYQDVITTSGSTMIKQSDGQFTGNVYDEVWQVYDIELDLGKSETRTYFFCMEYHPKTKELLYHSLEVYGKENK